MKIHIDWVSGISLEDSYSLLYPHDYGIYQVYGTHPVYGKNVLLYIGKARDQKIGERLKQHEKFYYNQDSDQIQVYTGRIGSNNPKEDYDQWGSLIDIAEKLLIFTHQPAYNSSNINSAKDIPINAHIMNWGNRGMLLPEVSAFRYFATDQDHFPTYGTLTDAHRT